MILGMREADESELDGHGEPEHQDDGGDQEGPGAPGDAVAGLLFTGGVAPAQAASTSNDVCASISSMWNCGKTMPPSG